MSCFLVNVELYFILTNPFYPTYKRTLRFWKYILISSFLYSLIFNLLLLILPEFKTFKIKDIMKSLLRFNLIFGNLIASILIFKKLRREGISKSLIRRVINNWFGLIIISTISFIIYPIGQLEMLFNPDSNNIDLIDHNKK